MGAYWRFVWYVGWALAACFVGVCLLFLGKLTAPYLSSAAFPGVLIESASAQTAQAQTELPCLPDAPAALRRNSAVKQAPVAVNNYLSCTADGKAGSNSGAAPGDGGKPGDVSADTNQAIANTMAAVSAAIAAITLVLTFGTSWIAKLSMDVDKHKRAVEKSRVEIDHLHNDIRLARQAHLDLLAHLHETKESLRQHIHLSGKSNTAWAEYAKLASQLEILMSTKAASRKTAFGVLLAYLQAMQDADLEVKLDRYTRKCHDWLRMNNALPEGDAPSWCLLLSAYEQRAWTDDALEVDRARGEEFV